MADTYITPEDFKAISKDKTCAEMGWDQADVDSRFKGTGATPAWTVDEAAWQRALIVGSDSHRMIMPGSKGKPYYFRHGLWYDDLKFKIVGNHCQWKSTTNTPFTYLTRKHKPTSRSEAEAMIGRADMDIEYLTVDGNGRSHTAIDFNSAIVNIHHCELNNVNTGMHVDFCLWANVYNNRVTGGNNGILAGLAIQGDTEMSSNLGRFVNNRTHTVSGVAFSNEQAYETVWEQNTVEGNGTCQHAMVIDFTNKTTAKNFKFDTFHYEQVGGATGSIFKIRTRDQKINLRNVIAHYKGLLVDAHSTNGGGVYLEDVHWAVGDPDGKWYRSSNNTWRFRHCSGINESNAADYFTTSGGGAVPQYGKRTSVGYNSYMIEPEQWDS